VRLGDWKRGGKGGETPEKKPQKIAVKKLRSGQIRLRSNSLSDTDFKRGPIRKRKKAKVQGWAESFDEGNAGF